MKELPKDIQNRIEKDSAKLVTPEARGGYSIGATTEALRAMIHWEKMNLAPTDGTPILITLYDANGTYKGQNVASWSYMDDENYPCDGHWRADSGKYRSFALYYVHPELSRWTRLPNPPNIVESKGKKAK